MKSLMMKKSLLLLMIMAAITACVQKSENTSEQSVKDSVTVITENHTDVQSYSWLGEYAGVFPCDDCEGIETIITLREDSTYVQKSTYLGKDNSFEETGTFSLIEPGSRLVLKSTDSEQSYLLGDDTLTLLNSEGKVTEGELADAYVLKKKS
ncbi:MAG: hypothetical protein H6Q19_532 [Bacteroidetes bacterium]|nr:hypothetical protein [Bacteroidota bacterium]